MLFLSLFRVNYHDSHDREWEWERETQKGGCHYIYWFLFRGTPPSHSLPFLSFALLCLRFQFSTLNVSRLWPVLFLFLFLFLFIFLLIFFFFFFWSYPLLLFWWPEMRECTPLPQSRRSRCLHFARRSKWQAAWGMGGRNQTQTPTQTPTPSHQHTNNNNNPHWPGQKAAPEPRTVDTDMDMDMDTDHGLRTTD